jgi:hypothetical protein
MGLACEVYMLDWKSTGLPASIFHVWQSSVKANLDGSLLKFIHPSLVPLELGSRNGKCQMSKGDWEGHWGEHNSHVSSLHKRKTWPLFLQWKGDKGWEIKGTMKEGLGKLGFGDTALCSSSIQERHHSKHPKHPRWQTSKDEGRVCLQLNCFC